MSVAEVSADLDRIQAPPDIAGWSENLVMQVDDSGAGLSVWCHGRSTRS